MLGNDQIKSIFVELNDFMEKKINDKIEKEKYYIDVPLITSYNYYEKENRLYLLKPYCLTIKKDFYNNYYFGQNAINVTGMD